MDYEERVLSICEEWQNALAERARNITAAHQALVQERRAKSKKTTEWYKYNVRSRVSNGVLQIQWLESKWIKAGGYEKFNKLVSDYVKPSVKHGYYEKTFRKASEEELLKIMATEAKLRNIRKRVRVIGLIKNAIKLNIKSAIDGEASI